MTNLLATTAFVLFLATSALAQQKSPRSATKSASGTRPAGTISPTDAVRSDPSAADTHDGTMGVSTGLRPTSGKNRAGTSTSRPAPTDPDRRTNPNSAVKAPKKMTHSGR